MAIAMDLQFKYTTHSKDYIAVEQNIIAKIFISFIMQWFQYKLMNFQKGISIESFENLSRDNVWRSHLCIGTT